MRSKLLKSFCMLLVLSVGQVYAGESGSDNAAIGTGAAMLAPVVQGPAPAPEISKTSLAEARGMWAAAGATTVSEGHLAIGGGNGIDGLSQVGLEQVLLVTVAGVEFEGLPVARYAFVDDVLYAVSAQLRRGYTKHQTPFKELDNDALSQLQQSLTRKYGKPRAFNEPLGGKKPSIFIWDLKENELTLTTSIGFGGHTLTLVNKALAKKVAAYKKTECKKHRQKGETPTLVTTICL
ncbi:MAG TPA: hypothetical protein VGC21_01330 [Telluria sp.]|jgi:hypothetical protein